MTTQEFKNKVQKEYDRVAVARLVNTGFEVYSFSLFDDEKYIGYCLEIADNSYEVFIDTNTKDNIESLDAAIQNETIYHNKIKLLKVVGGGNLEKIDNMFSGANIETLDLSLFDTSKVKLANGVFFDAHIENLILPEKILLNNLVVANSMFCDAIIESNLIISNAKMNNLMSVEQTFKGARIPLLRISNISLKKLEKAEFTFMESKIKYLHIIGIIVDKLKYMRSTFERIKCDKLILDFDNSNVYDMYECFYLAKIHYFDISKLTDGNCASINKIFKGCVIKDKAILDSSTQPRLFEAFTKENNKYDH